jgi:hypothetical protein
LSQILNIILMVKKHRGEGQWFGYLSVAWSSTTGNYNREIRSKCYSCCKKRPKQ